MNIRDRLLWEHTQDRRVYCSRAMDLICRTEELGFLIAAGEMFDEFSEVVNTTSLSQNIQIMRLGDSFWDRLVDLDTRWRKANKAERDGIRPKDWEIRERNLATGLICL